MAGTEPKAGTEPRTQDALNESRILVLGVQVLLGFQYSSVLEPAFASFPRTSQLLDLVALALLGIAFGLFAAPAPNHLLVWSDHEGPELQRFVTLAVGIALMPFAGALAIDVYLAGARGAGTFSGIVMGIATFLCAIFFWYGLEAIRLKTVGHRSRAGGQSMASNDPSTEEKIQHALTDARVVLPGAQALLGFQLIGVFLGGFSGLPISLRYVHLTSLSLVTLSTILLMTPAAYHRLVDEGEPSEDFYRLAKRAVLLSMIPLAAGICGDFFIVARKVSASLTFASLATGVLAAMFAILWFGIGLIKWKRGDLSGI
jgi:hypothetical protein